MKSSEEKIEDKQPAPEEVPMDIDEWGHTKQQRWSLLVAGFRDELRIKGGLRGKYSLAEWERKFQEFYNSPRPATPAR